MSLLQLNSIEDYLRRHSVTHYAAPHTKVFIDGGDHHYGKLTLDVNEHKKRGDKIYSIERLSNRLNLDDIEDDTSDLYE